MSKEAVTELKTYNTNYNYAADSERISKFLIFYTEEDTPKYLNQLKNLKGNIDIFLDDIALFDTTGLCNRIEENAMTYISFFYKAIDNILFNENEVFLEDDDNDIFLYHRIARFKEKHPSKKITDVFPSHLLRNYGITIVPRKNSLIYSVREIKSKDIGKLIKVRGIVTKVSQVKPSIKVATYICESCGSEIYQQVNGDIFDTLEECMSEKCKLRKIKGTLSLQTKGSKFIKYQNVKIQELTCDVPYGCIPRSLDVECYAESTEQCKPGDFVILSGVFLPKPYTGFKKVKAGLLTETFLFACKFENQNAVLQEKSLFEIPKIQSIEGIIESIAPEIFGMSDIKKILLLMLVGAPTTVKKDGMRIRGDINVLLLGDPGIAKSQLLKTVVKISQRGVYTTGKGSSGVGLTASVSKDPITGEIVLEGGALVLSDKGVCCIDELDKMNEIDRVSIHEVMEQQSVSISKAGINTTLNARCAVLGAANPLKGRYNPKKSVEANAGLPCALLSRFDVIIVIRDEADLEKDQALANHIANLHIDEEKERFSYSELRAFIEKAKSINPILPKNLIDKLTNAYVEARKESTFLTPRYLLSLIRLSLAHSRLRMSEKVDEEDVDEAIRLMEVSKIHQKKSKKTTVHPRHAIYNIIIKLPYESKNDTRIVKMIDIMEATKNKFTVEQVKSCIAEFEDSGIWAQQEENLVIFN